jgi:ribosomal protein L11 methyltransferase
MAWQEFVVEVAASALQELEQALFDCGAVAVSLEDAGDAPILEPAPGTTPLWPRMRLRALFDAGVSIGAVRAALAEALPAATNAGGGRFDVVGERDWTRAWLAHARPLRFGARLCVTPAALAPRDLGADVAVVELEPGLAFGTGTHPSTAACLEWIAAADVAGARVLDYGCGSGVLAIAALKRGAARATAVDIDPQARTACAANAERNAVAGRLCVLAPEELGARAYDVAFANILAGPLVDLAPRLALLVRPGGALVLAGILADQADFVAAAYAPFFDVAAAQTSDTWASLACTRREAP